MFRVLIVDDNVLNGQIVATSLRQERHERASVYDVVTAATPTAARQCVTEASIPFDVFLIDLNLGAEIDGIELMQELRRLSPDSDAIMFTGDTEAESGLRAVELGAYRYLAMPFDRRDLIWNLRTLEQHRRIRRERDWLRVLSDVAESSQRADTVLDVAEILVHGGIRLGFERARLWHVAADRSTLCGMTQAGSSELNDFDKLTLAVNKSPYLPRVVQADEAIIFQGTELGRPFLEEVTSGSFQPPRGEWVTVPLKSGTELVAVLVLDNADQDRVLSSEERKLISLLGRQAAVALSRAHLFELEQRKSRDLQVLNEIGRRITSRAAADLDELLLEVRQQIGAFIDVANFVVVLRDEALQKLDFRLQFEHGRQWPRRWFPLERGLVGYVISSNAPLSLPNGSHAFRREQGIALAGRAARSWLGVPLRVADKAIGAVVVQHYHLAQAFSAQQEQLLGAITDTIAGAIQAAWVKEKEQDTAQRLEVLQQFGAAFMTLAEESDHFLWHAVVTAATADYALQFNRAALFWRLQTSYELEGFMGVGQFSGKAARRDWRRDKQRGFDLQRYLEDLRNGRLRITPIEGRVKGMRLLAGFEHSAIQEVLDHGMRVVVSADQASDRLPADFISTFGQTDYAVVPIRVGRGVSGVVVVDNLHNTKPLLLDYLDHLETILAQAALVAENARQRRIRERIVRANYEILREIAERSLGNTLEDICKAVQEVTSADSVVIYPLQAGVGHSRYDTAAVAAVGLRAHKPAGGKIRHRGITAHILRAGALVIADVAKAEQRFNNLPLGLHKFIQREGVRAFMGLRIKDPVSGEALGAIYLNFHRPRPFSERERLVGEMFANMTATAIRMTRQAEVARADLLDAETQGQASRKELLSLRNILEESLDPDTDENKLIRSVLGAAREVLDKPETQVMLLLREWESPTNRVNDPQEVQRQYAVSGSGELHTETEPDIAGGIAGYALQTGQIVRINDTRRDQEGIHYCPFPPRNLAELDVPLRSGRRIIGVINAGSPQPNTFDEADEARLDRLGKVAALALDNVRRQAHLRTLLEAARAMTTPTDLGDTSAAILTAVRDIAPGVSPLTIWYRDPENKELWLADSFGVKDIDAVQARKPNPDSVVARVMARHEPLWAFDAGNEPLLGARFRPQEEVKSCVALPLRANGEAVGVIFLNYRQPHDFSNEERALFPLLAEIAAASVRDAALLKQAQQERQRLRHSLEITDAVGTALSLHETLDRILEKLAAIFPSALPCVLIYREADRELEFAHASFRFYKVDNPGLVGQVRLPLTGPGLSTRVARRSLAEGKPALENVGDVDCELTDYLRAIEDTRSQLSVGLMSSQRLLGVLVLESDQHNGFSADDETLVKGIAQQISLAIDRAKQNAQLRFKTTVASRTAWAAEIAHDIKNEIGSIRNRAYWISDEEHTIDEVRAFAAEIDASAERLADTVRSSAVAAGSEKQSFELETAIREWLKDHVQEKFPDIRVQCECRCPRLRVEANREILRRVVRHVLRNAVEAMNRKGCIACTIERTAWGQVEIRVADTGPGIQENIRQTLGIEPVSTKGEERGFGLLFAQSSLEDMGGSIRPLASAPGEGAVFALTLPESVQEMAAEVQ